MMLVLILYFAVCNKLELSPWTSAKQLLDMTWETGETVVDAATAIASTAKSYNDSAKTLENQSVMQSAQYAML